MRQQSILYKNGSSENEILINPSVNCENVVEPECSVSSQIDFPNYSLREKIKNWYIETSPSRKCLEKLLNILQEEGLDVPLSAAVLMGKRQVLSIRKVFGGNYFHIGIENAAEKLYNTLLEILAEHKVLLDTIVKQNQITSNLMEFFPIESEEKLTEFHAILKTHSDPYIRQMKSLLAGNAEKNLHEIFAQNIITNFNVDGSFGKKRLREYANVFKAIIDVISTFNENSDKTIRAAFQRQKKKYFKQMGRSKTKNNENREDDDSPKED